MRDARRGARKTYGDGLNRPPPEQLVLFEGLAIEARQQSDSSWISRHWPDYAPDGQPCAPAASSLVLWAESFPHLPKRTRAVLVALARKAGDGRTCHICLRHLAPAIGIGRNTVKQHLERLLAAGLVMMREQQAFGARSYDFALIVDLEDRASAIADGFVPYRPTARL